MMSRLFNAETLWAIAVILLVPVAIVAAAELDERLRQRESPLRDAVLTLRNWALPFFAAWALLVPVLALPNEEWYVRIAASGLLLALGAVASRVLRIVVDGYRHRPADDTRRPVPQLLLALPRIGLYLVVAWIFLAGIWNVDLGAALTALGVTSLVVSLALQDTLSGLASGVLLLGDQPFRAGDWISNGDIEGRVIDINWRTTVIEDRDGDVVVIPNSALASANITNYSSPSELHRVTVPVQVAYVNPPTLAKAMLIDAARSVPGVLEDPAPGVLVTQIDDPLMGYEVIMWVNDYAIVPRVKSDFGTLVWYQSHRHNVPLPSPAQDLFLHDAAALAAADGPSLADLRSDLTTSPLLALVADDDLDQLAQHARRERFAVGELIVASNRDGSDFLVLLDGQARLILIGPDGDEHTIADIGRGDALGLIEDERNDDLVTAARAMSDCEVVAVTSDALAEIGSRNTELAAALNRTAALRRRRVTRVARARATQLASDSRHEVER
ncbi:MAG: mechanosensitive ion channel domain-containing protein [Actinomycetota bacterium]